MHQGYKIKDRIKDYFVKNKTYYEILLVPQDASQEEIHASYRELIRQCKTATFYSIEEQEAALEELKDAYDTLSTPEERTLYDIELEEQGLKESSFWTERSQDTETTARLDREEPNEFTNSISSINQMIEERKGLMQAVIKGVAVGVGSAIVLFLILKLII